MTATVDTTRWPLVLVTADERVTAADAEHLMTALDAALHRADTSGERIALVLDIDRLDRQASTEFSQWFESHREHLARLIAAGASVVAPATLQRNRQLIADHPDAYPFPASCAATTEECASWALAHTRRFTITRSQTS